MIRLIGEYLWFRPSVESNLDYRQKYVTGDEGGCIIRRYQNLNGSVFQAAYRCRAEDLTLELQDDATECCDEDAVVYGQKVNHIS